MALFNYGYSYYATILEISAAGTPLAIAKLVAKYNALEQYDVSRRIVKLGSWLLVLMGILGFCILFFGSDFISEQILISKQQKFLPSDGALVLKSLSFGIPLVLVSAGFRGLFQAHEIMLPSALSQFIEQVVRIAFMLGATYFVMRVLGYGVVEGNVTATFAAAVGAVFSLLTLLYFYKKYSHGLEYRQHDSTNIHKSNKELVKEFFSVSIPFIFIVGLFPILNIIDQHNFIHVAIAPAFSSTFLPSITRLYALGDKKSVSIQINKVILALMMIVLPALVGMYILADPLYSAFYSRSLINADLLRFYLPLAILYSLYSLTSIIMQAINRQLINLITIVVGLIVKFATITPFVMSYETNGVVLSSMATYVTMILMNFVVINFEIKLRIVEFVKKFISLASACFIMFIAVAAVYESIIGNFVIESKLSSMTIIIICAVVGGILYFFVLNKLKFVEYLFNRKISIKTLINRRRRV